MLFEVIFACVVLVVGIITYITYLIANRAKRYPKIYESVPRPFFMMNDNRWGVFFIRMGLTFKGFSKSIFDKEFNKLTKFNEVKKTRDKKLISLVETYRFITWVGELIPALVLVFVFFYMIFTR